MDLERSAGGPPQHAAAPGVGLARAAADPAAGPRLQILTAEHASLLATRSLTWTESFSRMSMFLSVLSGAVIALALVAQASGFDEGFTVFAIPLLSVVLFVGVATVVRLHMVNNEDIRWVAGMNRLRHAYLELHPELGRYFITAASDDRRGAGMTMGFFGPSMKTASLSSETLARAFVTVPGMTAVIVSAVAGALFAVVALAVHVFSVGALAAAAIGFVVTLLLLGLYGYRSIAGLEARLQVEFPSVEVSTTAGAASA
jgi:hypothetical protein